jgi:hypothetical protein
MLIWKEGQTSWCKRQMRNPISTRSKRGEKIAAVEGEGRGNQSSNNDEDDNDDERKKEGVIW